MDDSAVLNDCFRRGALDYLTKPFNVSELLVKIERAKNHIYLADLRFNDFKLCLTTKDGNNINFTPKEYQILRLLSTSPNMTIKRDKIKLAIWPDIEMSGNTVDVHMFAIRKKIKPYGLSVEFIAPHTFSLKPGMHDQAIG